MRAAVCGNRKGGAAGLYELLLLLSVDHRLCGGVDASAVTAAVGVSCSGDCSVVLRLHDEEKDGEESDSEAETS